MLATCQTNQLSSSAMISRSHFDAEYYRRYYENRDTAVVDADMKRNEVKFVVAFCNHIGLKVRRFTDVGAGTGWWAEEFGRTYRACEVIETYDASEAACEVYGHKRVPVQNLAGPASDLVVCRDVLRYVPDTYIDRAINVSSGNAAVCCICTQSRATMTSTRRRATWLATSEPRVFTGGV
jgi:Methylase involved in ubiquinone/menaquinone biosynthesis